MVTFIQLYRAFFIRETVVACALWYIFSSGIQSLRFVEIQKFTCLRAGYCSRFSNPLTRFTPLVLFFILLQIPTEIFFKVACFSVTLWVIGNSSPFVLWGTCFMNVIIPQISTPKRRQCLLQYYFLSKILKVNATLSRNLENEYIHKICSLKTSNEENLNSKSSEVHPYVNINCHMI